MPGKADSLNISIHIYIIYIIYYIYIFFFFPSGHQSMKRVSEIEGTGPINMFLLSGSPIFCFPKDPQVYEIKMQERDRLEI